MSTPAKSTCSLCARLAGEVKNLKEACVSLDTRRKAEVIKVRSLTEENEKLKTELENLKSRYRLALQ